MISKCSSVRSIQFRLVKYVDILLDVVKANQNVRQWIVHLEEDEFTDYERQRLQDTMLSRNDNSIIVYNNISQKIDLIPQITQTFRVSPILYD